MWIFFFNKQRPLLALQLPHHMGHGHSRINQIVPASGAGLIPVKTAHVRVEIVSTAAVITGAVVEKRDNPL